MAGGRLVVLDRQGRDVKCYPLEDGFATLGSDSICDIRFMMPTVCPHHATVSVHTNQSVVHAVGAEPTLVNGVAVSVAALRHGDEITLGGRRLRWEYSDPAQHRVRHAIPMLAGPRRAWTARRARRATAGGGRPAPGPPLRASMPARAWRSGDASASSASGKQVAIVQPWGKDTSEQDETITKTTVKQGKRSRASRQDASDAVDDEDQPKRRWSSVGAAEGGDSTTKASLWCESRRAPRRTPLKIHDPPRVDHTKQAAIMLMTGHTPKECSSRRPALLLLRPSPARRRTARPSPAHRRARPSQPTPRRPHRRSEGPHSISLLEIGMGSRRSDGPSRSERRSPLASPLLGSPKKSALKDPSARKSARKTESIKFDLSNLDSGQERSSDVILYDDLEPQSSPVDESSASENELTLHYSESSSAPSPSPKRNSRSSKILEKSLRSSVAHTTPQQTLGKNSLEQSMLEQTSLGQTSSERSKLEQTTLGRTSLKRTTPTKKNSRSSKLLEKSIRSSAGYTTPEQTLGKNSLEQSMLEQTTLGQTSSEQSKLEQTTLGRTPLERTTPTKKNSRPSKLLEKSLRSSAAHITPEQSLGQNSLEQSMLEQTTLGQTSSERSKLEQTTLGRTSLERTTPMLGRSPRPKKSLRGSVILKKALENSRAAYRASRSTKNVSGQSYTTASSPRRTLETYSVVDLVSLDSESSHSVYGSTASFDSPPSARRTRSGKPSLLASSTPYHRPVKVKPKSDVSINRSGARKESPVSDDSFGSGSRKKTSTSVVSIGSSDRRGTRRSNVSNMSGKSNRSKTSTKRSASLTTPENTYWSVSLNTTKATRASKSRSRINDSDVLLLDDEDDASPRSSRRRSVLPTPRKNISVVAKSPATPPTGGCVTPENERVPDDAGTPVLSIQNLLDESLDQSPRSGSRNYKRTAKRNTVGVVRSIERPSTGVKAKSFTQASRRSAKRADASQDQDGIVTPTSAVQLVPEAVKNKHSTAKKPQSKRSLIDTLDESDVVKQLFSSPVKRNLSRSMSDFSRWRDDHAGAGPAIRHTVALSGRTFDSSGLSALDDSAQIAPEVFVSPLSTPNPSPNLSGIKRLFARGTPKNDLRDVRGVKNLMRTPRARRSIGDDLTRVSGVKKTFARSPKDRLSDVRLKELFAPSPRNDLRRISGVKALFKSNDIKKMASPDVRGVRGLFKASPRNELLDVSGVRALKRRSPRNELTGVEGVDRLFGGEEQPFTSDVSGVEELLQEPEPENPDATFDRLLGRPPLKAYGKSRSMTTIGRQRQKRAAKSLHDSINAITTNVEDWLHGQLQRSVTKKNLAGNVSRELQNLSTATVGGAAPVLAARARSSAASKDQSMLPIKKRYLAGGTSLGQSGREQASLGRSGGMETSLGRSGRAEASLGRSSRVEASGRSGRVEVSLGRSGRAEVSLDLSGRVEASLGRSDRPESSSNRSGRAEASLGRIAVAEGTSGRPRRADASLGMAIVPASLRLPIKKRVVVHSTPVKGVDATLNTTALARMSPIAALDPPPNSARTTLKQSPKIIRKSKRSIKNQLPEIIVPLKSSPKKLTEVETKTSTPILPRATRRRNAPEAKLSTVIKGRKSITITKKPPVLSSKPAQQMASEKPVSNKRVRNTRNQNVEEKARAPIKTRAKARRASVIISKLKPKPVTQKATETIRPTRKAKVIEQSRKEQETLRSTRKTKAAENVSSAKKKAKYEKETSVEAKSNTKEIKDSKELLEKTMRTRRNQKVEDKEVEIKTVKRGRKTQESSKGQILENNVAEHIPKRGRKTVVDVINKKHNTKKTPEKPVPIRGRRAQTSNNVSKIEIENIPEQKSRRGRKTQTIGKESEIIDVKEEIPKRGRRTQINTKSVVTEIAPTRGRASKLSQIANESKKPVRGRRKVESLPSLEERSTRGNRSKKVTIAQELVEVEIKGGRRTKVKAEIIQTTTTSVKRAGKRSVAESPGPAKAKRTTRHTIVKDEPKTSRGRKAVVSANAITSRKRKSNEPVAKGLETAKRRKVAINAEEQRSTRSRRR